MSMQVLRGWVQLSAPLTCLLTVISFGTALPSAQAKPSPFDTVSSQVTEPSQELFVSSTGSDTNTGTSLNDTYRTITQALKQAGPGSIIYLAPGQYTSATETFPLVVPVGVTLQGQDAGKGQGVVINGSGQFISSWWGRQNVTLLAGKESHISGLSVTNPSSRGTGIWIESANPTVENCTFTDNLREGIFIAGNANPTIVNNHFQGNSANGLSITGKAEGMIQNNVFQDTGFGIAIGDQATPQILNNQISENVDGIVVSHAAQPMLRGNRITQNKKNGLVVITNAQPNLGTHDSPGNNIFQENGQYAIYNATVNQSFAMSGNQISGEALLAPNGPTGLSADTPVLQPIEKAPVAALKAAPLPVPASSIKLQELEQRLEKSPSVTFEGKTYILKDSVLSSQTTP